MSDEYISDPENYEKMSVPFATEKECAAAMQAFLDDIWAARQKHRIANVNVVLGVRVEGDDKARVGSNFMGDSSLQEALTAFAFGKARKARKQYDKMIDALVFVNDATPKGGSTL